jgi:hypothetical protein
MHYSTWHAEQRRNRDQVAEVRGAVEGAPAVEGVPEGQVATSEEKQLLDNVSNRAAARFKIQIIHYENALVQSATYFRVSLACGIIGFGLLVAGVGLAFNAKQGSRRHSHWRRRHPDRRGSNVAVQE